MHNNRQLGMCLLFSLCQHVHVLLEGGDLPMLYLWAQDVELTSSGHILTWTSAYSVTLPERITESYKQVLFPLLRILWYKWICMSAFFPRALAVCSMRWVLRNPVLRNTLSFSPRHQGAIVFNLLTFIPRLRRKHLNILCSSSCNMAITSLWKLFYFQYFTKYVKIHIWLVKTRRAGTVWAAPTKCDSKVANQGKQQEGWPWAAGERHEGQWLQSQGWKETSLVAAFANSHFCFSVEIL